MDPRRYRVLDIAKKALQVSNFHHNTLAAVGELIGASGVEHPRFLTRRHIVRRLSGSKILLADQIYPKVEKGALLHGGNVEDPRLEVYWDRVDGTSFNFQN